jgi:threonine dehydrogenase-like Zn-dependent dehydrogenase
MKAVTWQGKRDVSVEEVPDPGAGRRGCPGGGTVDPMPMRTVFDKRIQLRMSQVNVKRWADDILPLLDDSDPLGVDSFTTHRMPLSAAPEAYRMFQAKQDGAVEVVLDPAA